MDGLEATISMISNLVAKENYEKGRADEIDKFTEILARLVTMEIIDLNIYELIKAELKEQKNE